MGWFSRTRVKAGDRAPDIAFQQKTLFGLLQPQRPVALIGPGTIEAARLERLLEALAQVNIDAYLIARPGEEGWRNHPRCLIDRHDEWRRIYGMTGEFLCLVRPDDHIGLFQRPIREEYLIVHGGSLAGTGAHSYSAGNATSGSEEAAKFRKG